VDKVKEVVKVDAPLVDVVVLGEEMFFGVSHLTIMKDQILWSLRWIEDEALWQMWQCQVGRIRVPVILCQWNMVCTVTHAWWSKS
jgi:hypothetical protein